MPPNVLEEKASEYLRLNGFFLISNFVIHFEDKQPEEIDFLGTKLPGSIEQTMFANGQFSTCVFQDDVSIPLDDNSNIMLLVGEATESTSRAEIQKRIDYLRNENRLRYSLQRFGIIQNDDMERLIKTGSLDARGYGLSLLRILFVINNELAEVFRAANGDIIFLSIKQLDDFIQSRAKIDIKQRARTLLPRWLHNELLRRL